MNWSDLREMRTQGLRPSLPVLVTVRDSCRTYSEEGFAVVRHSPGEPFPVELLDGLRVVLFLGDCNRAASVARAMSAKAVRPEELRTWCACYDRLDRQPVSCETNHAWEAA